MHMYLFTSSHTLHTFSHIHSLHILTLYTHPQTLYTHSHKHFTHILTCMHTFTCPLYTSSTNTLHTSSIPVHFAHTFTCTCPLYTSSQTLYTHPHMYAYIYLSTLHIFTNTLHTSSHQSIPVHFAHIFTSSHMHAHPQLHVPHNSLFVELFNVLDVAEDDAFLALQSVGKVLATKPRLELLCGPQA